MGKAIGSFENATVYAYVEDVSAQNGPAEIVARHRLDDIAHRGGSDDELEVVLDGADPDARKEYAVRIHVALHDGEDIRRGDFLTTQSYPVLTFGHPDRVTVALDEVR